MPPADFLLKDKEITHHTGSIVEENKMEDDFDLDDEDFDDFVILEKPNVDAKYNQPEALAKQDKVL